MALQKLLVAVTTLAALAQAIPTIAYPLNSQVPPVVRLSQPYSYAFPSSTFFSNFPLTYTLASGPDWLSLDGTTRTLSGTPSKSDVSVNGVSGVPISITASDSTGSALMNSTLVITNNEAPSIRISPALQLPLYGIFASPSTLLYHPSSPFKIQFDRQTFSSSNLHYYAVMTDNTPLPAWVIFDGNSLTFSGLTPDYASLIQPPQIFGIRLIASDIEGFAGASISFEIEVGVHLLSVNTGDLAIKAAPGDEVDYRGLAEAIQIDGRQAKGTELLSVTANTPSWLNFDNKTLFFAGTVPKDATSLNVTVMVKDIYEDVASATISVDMPTGSVPTGAIFNANIGDLNATIGSSFKYDLSSYLNSKSDVQMEADFSPGKPWIAFDSTTFILSGDVPDDASPTAIAITLNAKSKSSGATAVGKFNLVVNAASVKSSPPPTATKSQISTAPAITSKHSSAPSSLTSHGGMSAGSIIAIAIPIGLLFLSVIVAFCCYQRRRRRDEARYPKHISKSDISLPQEEAQSSVIEIVSINRAPPPEPLQLDMSAFGRPTSSVMMDDEPVTNPKRKSQQILRRSQTASAISDQRLSRVLRRFDSSARSYSDNALSRTRTSWSSIQESYYPTTTKSQKTSSGHRLSRNYSRKGHTRQSARILSSHDIQSLKRASEPRPISGVVRPSTRLKSEASILNLHDSNFSFLPIDNFSALSTNGTLSKHAVDPNQPIIERPPQARASRRHSRFIPNFALPMTGVGHGGRDSISPLPIRSSKRGSIGHGQDPTASKGLSRDSRTWLTVGTADTNPDKRFSVSSNYSAPYPDTPALNQQRMSIRIVPKSSSTAAPSSQIGGGRSSSSVLSSSSKNSRPVSRRIGSSPFFGGSSARASTRKAPSKWMRTSYADSPTVPEESPHNMAGLEETILQSMREMGGGSEAHQRDSFGISYGLAREGTRQLRSYIQGQLRQRSSSVESKDSRFESANTSVLELELPHHDHDQDRDTGTGTGNDDEDDERERRRPYDERHNYSVDSWETSDSRKENVISYVPEITPKITTAREQARVRAGLIAAGGGLGDHPVNGGKRKSRMLDGPGARIWPGRGKRPISVDVNREVDRKRSSRAMVEGREEGSGEGDYTAYI